MNTATNDKAHPYAVGSDNAAEWHKARTGRWTGSMIGDLMTTRALTEEELDTWGPTLCPTLEPYTVTKTGPNAGQQRRTPGYADAVKEAAEKAGLVVFGSGALTAIASKAAERLAGEPEHSAQTWSMTRGLELEPVARLVLNAVWRPVDNCPYCPLPGVIPAGATPDGLVDFGEAVIDIKCPEKIGKLVQFATLVRDDDFEALEAWNKDYAWQIMMEAKCAGVDHAWLVYFTDRIPAITEVRGHPIQEWVNAQVGNDDGTGGYLLESGGVAFVARRFTLTPERSKRIEHVLAAAEVECDRMVKPMLEESMGGWAFLGEGRTLTAVDVINAAPEPVAAPTPEAVVTEIEPLDDLPDEDMSGDVDPEPEPFHTPETDADRIARWVGMIEWNAPETTTKVAEHGVNRLIQYVRKWHEGIRKDIE